MNEEGSLFDVPPAAIGRYLVRQPLGTGTTGSVFQAHDPTSQALVTIKLLKVNLSPDEAHGVAGALGRLVDRMPRHDALVEPLDAGLDEIEAYFVTAFVAGDSLESALRDFGPAAIEDLVPRLRSLAGALDAAHDAGLVHGALHPRDVLISPDTTHLTGVGVAPILATAAVALPLRRPYSAPEVAKGSGATAAADQFSLAAIAFEWLFGRRITGPAERLVEVRTLPGVDRDALSNAFTIALAPDPETRFDSCRAFAEAVAGALDTHTIAGPPSLARGRASSGEISPERPAAAEADVLADAVIAAPLIDDDDLVASAPIASAAIPIDLGPAPAPAQRDEPVAWNSGMASPEKSSERFGGGALIATAVVCLLAGFAAGYMAKPRALQRAPPQELASASGTDGAVAPARDTSASSAPAPTRAPKALEVPQAASSAGRLLVRSSPSGATVSVDGVTRGVTPLALRDVELGSRSVVVARRGYIADDQRVVLTSARPSRSLEVRLTAESAKPAPLRPSTAAATAAGRAGEISPKLARPPASEGGPATVGRPATASASTGALAVESRPSGAAVTINGRASGTTPLRLDALAPGEYRIGLALHGYQSFSTTVRVVAGGRARAAASLSLQERE